MAGAKAQLVKWGNSQAVRIPKTILEQCNLREGEELEIRVENGHIWLEPLSEKPTLKALVEKITPENRHGEQDWGKPGGGGNDTLSSVTLHNTCYRTLHMIGPVIAQENAGAKTEAPAAPPTLLFSMGVPYGLAALIRACDLAPALFGIPEHCDAGPDKSERLKKGRESVWQPGAQTACRLSPRTP